MSIDDSTYISMFNILFKIAMCVLDSNHRVKRLKNGYILFWFLSAANMMSLWTM